MSHLLSLHRQETEQLDPSDFLVSFPSFVLQYLDDSPAHDRRKALVATRYSPEIASRKEAQGCGVFFAPNAFDGRRRMERLLRIQAVYLDIDVAKERDGLPASTIDERKERSLADLLLAEPSPHAVVETKNGLQPIWRVDTAGLTDVLRLFRLAMAGLVNRFGGDPAAKDATRLLRLPGSLHQKAPADPFRCGLVWNELDAPPYRLHDVIDAFPAPSRSGEQKCGPTAYASATPYDSLDIAEVVVRAAGEAGVNVDFHRNADGSRQIIENGEITSGFLSARGNFCHSASGKARKGGPVQLVRYYLGLSARDACHWLERTFGAGAAAGKPTRRSGVVDTSQP